MTGASASHKLEQLRRQPHPLQEYINTHTHIHTHKPLEMLSIMSSHKLCKIN